MWIWEQKKGKILFSLSITLFMHAFSNRHHYEREKLEKICSLLKVEMEIKRTMNVYCHIVREPNKTHDVGKKLNFFTKKKG
jgi:hypothetical protein